MRRRLVGNSVPAAIDRYINSAYDNVLLVAENIESVNKAAENIEYLQRYLGVYEGGSPSERPDGSPLETGDFYYSDKATYYYNADDDTWTEFNPEELLTASADAVDAAARAEEARDVAVDVEQKAYTLVGGTDIGDYEDDPTFNNITDYVVFGRGTSEIALFKVEENVDLPYTVDSTANPHPTDDDNLRAYTSTATMYTYEETTYLTDGQVVVDATSELKNYVVYLWDSASGERERLDVVYDYTTNNSNQIVLTDTYPVGSIVTIVFEDIGQSSDTYLKKQEAEQKYGDHNKQANRGSENSHPASAISTTNGSNVQTMVEAIKGKNELNNSNFLIPSPDDITHPSSVATTYSAGTQIFSGLYAGDDGCTITYVNGLVTCTAGSYEYRVSNTNGLEYVPTFSSSVAGYDGLPNQSGITHALVDDEYVITVTTEAGSVFTVKFEQGSVATGHEVGDINGYLYFLNVLYADDFINGLSGALDAATEGTVIYLSNKNYNIVGKYKLDTVTGGDFVGNEKKNITIIGAGMPSVMDSKAGMIEGSGTVIQGSLINFADGFICYNLGIDCGTNVVDGLSSGEYLEGFIPGTHKLDSVWSDYASYIKDVHFDKIRVLMKAPTADVATHKHAALVEHIDGGTQGYIETINGLHGYVLKSRNIISTAPVKSIDSTGESVFMKSDTYTQCSGLVGGTFIIGDEDSVRSAPVICNASNGVNVEDMEFDVVAKNVTAALIGSGSGSLKRFNIGSVKCNDSTTTPVVVPFQAQRWTVDSWNLVNSGNNGLEVANGSVAVHLGDGAVYDCLGDGYSLDGVSSHGSLRAENCGGWGVYNNGGRSIVNPAVVTAVNCTLGTVSELYKATPLVLQNGWADSAPVGYEFSLSVIGSTVQLSGQIGGSPTSSIFMTVPIGYRPKGIRRFPVYVNGSVSGEVVDFITYDPSSSVLTFDKFSEITGGNYGIELSSVSWVIDN